MKLQLSDGDNIKECEIIEQDNGNISVMIDNKAFEFDIPELNTQSNLYAFTDDGPFWLSSEELELLAYYRGETIQLYNPNHDAKGRFASKNTTGAFGLFGIGKKSSEEKEFWANQEIGDYVINKWLVESRDDQDIKKIIKRYGKRRVKNYIRGLLFDFETWHSGRSKQDWHPDAIEQYDALQSLHDHIDNWNDLPDDIELELDKNEIIKLSGNPYHDKYGKFTSVGSAVRKTGVATQVVGLASIVAGLGTMTATRAAVNIKTKQIQKSEGIEKSEARDKVLSQNIISRKIGNKKVEFTYEQVDRFGIKLAKMGRNAFLAGLGIELIGSATAIYGILGEEREKYRQGYESYSRPQEPVKWPKHATEAKFKTMYRELSKKLHPDVGGSIEVMQNLNNLKDTSNYHKMEQQYKDIFGKVLEILLENAAIPTEVLELLDTFFYTLEQAAQDNEYVVIPVEEDDDLPDWVVVEDGELILDPPSIELILDAYHNLKKEAENEGTD